MDGCGVWGGRLGLAVEPSEDEVDDARLLEGREFHIFGDVPPFVQTAAATSRRRMLRDEDGMAVPGGLAPVLGWMCRGQVEAYKICRVAFNRGPAFRLNVGKICRGKMKTAAELGVREAGESFVVGHSRAQAG